MKANFLKSANYLKSVTTGVVVGLGVSAVAPAAFAAEVKMGYIDMQKAIQETTTGKKAKDELEKEFNRKKEELQKKEADIKKMSEDFEKKKSVLSEEARDKKAAELNQEMQRFRENVAQSQMAIQQKEREKTEPIITKLQEVIEKMATDGGYTMILERSGNAVLWAKKDVDITADVVKAYEAQVASGSKDKKGK